MKGVNIISSKILDRKYNFPSFCTHPRRFPWGPLTLVMSLCKSRDGEESYTWDFVNCIKNFPERKTKWRFSINILLIQFPKMQLIRMQFGFISRWVFRYPKSSTITLYAQSKCMHASKRRKDSPFACLALQILVHPHCSHDRSSCHGCNYSINILYVSSQKCSRKFGNILKNVQWVHEANIIMLYLWLA